MWFIIKLILIAVIAICALVKFIKRTPRANIRTWFLIAAALFGLLANTFIRFGFPGYATGYFALIAPIDIGFVLAATAALTNKRVWGLVSTIYIWTLGVMNAAGYFDYENLLCLVWVTIWVGLTIWQFKKPKAVPLWVWIILAVPGLLVNLGVALLMPALLVWLSSTVDTDLKMPQVNQKSVQPQQSPTEIADRLKALESLQELLNSGVITQEEFDAKKKQLLG